MTYFRNLNSHLFSWASRDLHLHCQRSFNGEPPVKKLKVKKFSLFTQIGTYGTRWMYHNNFHLCTTTWDSGQPRYWNYTHNVEANRCKYGPETPSSSISGGSLSLMTLVRPLLPARNVQSLSLQKWKYTARRKPLWWPGKTTVYYSHLMTFLQNKVLVIHV